MEVEELIKLALVNHDIDQEKILSNILKKGRRRMAVKKVVISIGISALLAVPILAMSLGLAKGDAPLPPEASVTTDTAGAEISVIQSTIQSTMNDNVTEMFIENSKIVVGKEEDYFSKNESLNITTDKLANAFEKYDSDTNFLIKVQYIPQLDDYYLFEGKTIAELIDKVIFLKTEYASLVLNTREKSVDDEKKADVKKAMEEAQARCAQALEAWRKYVLSEVINYFSTKEIHIVSSDHKSFAPNIIPTINIISTKNKVYEIINEINEKDGIIYRFMLGNDISLLTDRDFLLYE